MLPPGPAVQHPAAGVRDEPTASCGTVKPSPTARNEGLLQVRLARLVFVRGRSANVGSSTRGRPDPGSGLGFCAAGRSVVTYAAAPEVRSGSGARFRTKKSSPNKPFALNDNWASRNGLLATWEPIGRHPPADPRAEAAHHRDCAGRARRHTRPAPMGRAGGPGRRGVRVFHGVNPPADSDQTDGHQPRPPVTIQQRSGLAGVVGLLVGPTRRLRLWCAGRPAPAPVCVSDVRALRPCSR